MFSEFIPHRERIAMAAGAETVAARFGNGEGGMESVYDPINILT